jgi:hypothetical protein
MQFLPIFKAQSEWGPGSSRVTKLAKVQYCENNCKHVQIFASLQQAVFAHICCKAETVFGVILLYKAAFSPAVLLQLMFNHCNGAAM